MKQQHVHSKWLFNVIAIMIPAVLLLLIELVLRMAGFAKDMPLFIDNPQQPKYQLANPDVIQRYFPDGYAPRVSLEPTFFLKQKPANGLRVVVQGGSTAAGFPYGLGASLAGMLEQRLKQSYPEHHVEVINVAMSAVNSYFLLDTVDEIIAQQPDAVLIYAGHNEYLGIFGVGSSFTAFQQPLLMRLFLAMRQLALFDAMQTVAIKLQSTPPSPAQSSRTLMSQVARHKDIPYGSNRYHAGLSQFSNNMNALIERYNQANIKVYISTIASNLKDHKPFASTPSSASLTKPDSQTIDSAIWHFNYAKQLATQGKHQQAKSHFVLAKEHDNLRFRAPEAINTHIREIAKAHEIILVEAEKALQQISPNGIIGNELMLEHLHPNLPGYFIIADAFYKAITATKLASPQIEIPTADAWRHRPITPAEEYYGYAHIKSLKADYPFTDLPQPINLSPPRDWQQIIGRAYFDKKIDWLTLMQRLHQGYTERGNMAMQLKTALLLADALPHDKARNQLAADLLRKQNRHFEAAYYRQRATMLQ